MKLPIQKFNQVALVIADHDKVVQTFINVLGVRGFEDATFGRIIGEDGEDKLSADLSMENAYYNGKYYETYAVRNSFHMFDNGVDLEILYPYPDSMDNLELDYLKWHGPGVHHLDWTYGGDFETNVGIMSKLGNPLYSVVDIDEVEKCCFANHRSTLGVDFEIHWRPEDYVLPADEGGLPKYKETGIIPEKPYVTSILGFTIATARLDAAVKMLRDYDFCQWEEGETENYRYAKSNGLNVDMMLLEPKGDGEMAEKIREFLAKNRDAGVIEVTFDMPQGTEATKKTLEDAGFDVTVRENGDLVCDMMSLLGTNLYFKK